MSIPNYLYALANHKGPATVTAGGMTIPVKIMDIDHESDLRTNETIFKCMVVNKDQIIAVNNSANYISDYVARMLYESVARKRESRVSWTYRANPMAIDRVIFNAPATIVFWTDGTKTVVKCQEGDVYSKETGLALCIAKKALGNKGNFNDIFRKWITEEDVE